MTANIQLTGVRPLAPIVVDESNLEEQVDCKSEEDLSSDDSLNSAGQCSLETKARHVEQPPVNEKHIDKLKIDHFAQIIEEKLRAQKSVRRNKIFTCAAIAAIIFDSVAITFTSLTPIHWKWLTQEQVAAIVCSVAIEAFLFIGLAIAMWRLRVSWANHQEKLNTALNEQRKIETELT